MRIVYIHPMFMYVHVRAYVHLHISTNVCMHLVIGIGSRLGIPLPCIYYMAILKM